MVINTHNIATNIVEEFEKFLDEKGVIIPNEERNGDDGESCIFGTDFGELADSVEFHIIQVLEEIKKRPYNPMPDKEGESLADFTIRKYSYGGDVWE